jgi:hypothetical protein
MDYRDLMKFLDTSAAGLASYLSVSPPAVYRWVHGSAKPAGLNRTLINLALLVGRISPDILRASWEAPIPTDPLARVSAFFDGGLGLHYYFDVSAADIAAWACDPPPALGRLAALLGLVGALMPGLRLSLVQAYPGVVERSRRARIREAQSQKQRDQGTRQRNAKYKGHLREMPGE